MLFLVKMYAASVVLALIGVSTISIKDQIINTLRSAGHMVSVAYSSFLYINLNTEIILSLWTMQKWVIGWIYPVGCSMLMLDLDLGHCNKKVLMTPPRTKSKPLTWSTGCRGQGVQCEEKRISPRSNRALCFQNESINTPSLWS